MRQYGEERIVVFKMICVSALTVPAFVHWATETVRTRSAPAALAACCAPACPHLVSAKPCLTAALCWMPPRWTWAWWAWWWPKEPAPCTTTIPAAQSSAAARASCAAVAASTSALRVSRWALSVIAAPPSFTTHATGGLTAVGMFDMVMLLPLSPVLHNNLRHPPIPRCLYFRW